MLSVIIIIFPLIRKYFNIQITPTQLNSILYRFILFCRKEIIDVTVENVNSIKKIIKDGIM